MDEKRFPPPGNQAGYRDAASPALDEPHAPDAPSAPIARHLVVQRPADPDLALARAATEDIAAKQEARIAENEAIARRAAKLTALALVVVLALIYVYAALTHHPRRFTPPPSPPAGRV